MKPFNIPSRALAWLRLGALGLALSIALPLIGTAPQFVGTAHAAGVTDYTENKVVDHIFRATAWTAPTVLCVALTTSAPSDSAAGTEASYTGYARGCLNPSTSNWKSTNGTTSGASSGTSGQTCNASTITFGSAATSGPTVVTHFELWDASSSGNRLYYGTLTASKTINNGDPAPTAPADSICFTPGD